MTAADLLAKVKTNLNVTGNYQDDTISEHIEGIKYFLLDAGAPSEVLATTAAADVISRGVADTWNYGNGDTKLSEYFFQRAKQLCTSERISPTVLKYANGLVYVNAYVVEAQTYTLNIDVKAYDSTDDGLNLYIDGYLCSNAQYSIVSNSQIELLTPVDSGTLVKIVVTKAETQEV